MHLCCPGSEEGAACPLGGQTAKDGVALGAGDHLLDHLDWGRRRLSRGLHANKKSSVLHLLS